MEKLTKRERKIKRKMEKQGKEGARFSREKLGKVAVWGVILLVLGLGGWFIWKELSKPLPGQAIPSLGNQHIASLDEAHEPYNSTPPTSGPHMGGLAEWGVHDETVPEELFLHNMEDGGVIVHFNCEATMEIQVVMESCEELVEKLSKIVGDYTHVLMHPYSKIETRIALTAWERLDKFNGFDEQRIREFIRAYEGIDHHVK